MRPAIVNGYLTPPPSDRKPSIGFVSVLADDDGERGVRGTHRNLSGRQRYVNDAMV